MKDMLDLWESRFQELAREKHKLQEQYEQVEREEVEQIQTLRKQAADFRVKMAEQGSVNDQLYQDMTVVCRQQEQHNREYYKLKNELHDGQQEVAKIEDQIDNLKRQMAVVDHERQKMQEERAKLVKIERELDEECHNQYGFKQDLEQKMKQALTTLQNLQTNINSITNEGIKPSQQEMADLDHKLKQIQK